MLDLDISKKGNLYLPPQKKGWKLQNEKANSLAIDFDSLDKISVEKDLDCKRTKHIPGKTNSIIVEDTEETNEKALTDVLAEAEVFKVNLTLTVPENEEQVAIFVENPVYFVFSKNEFPTHGTL